MAVLDVVRRALQRKPDAFQAAAPRPEVLDALQELTKQSQTFGLIHQRWQQSQGVPRPETIATFQDFARVYKREVWVYACVKRIAEAIADIPLQARMRKKDGTEEPMPDSPLQKLLDSVNPHMGPSLFKESLASSLDLFGNAYIEKVRRGKTGPPVELYPLRPDRMRIVPHPTDYIEGFIYEVNAKKLALLRNDVVHLKTVHPLDDYYGLSVLEAAALSVEVDQYAIGYNRSFFKNNATPEGIMRNKMGVKKDDLERIKTEFKRLFGGPKNAHKIAWMDGDWEWIQLGMKQRDAQFIDARKMSREEILAAFGVPPVMVGIFEYANYANSKEQQAIFYEATVLPRLQRIEDQLNEQLAAEFGDGWVIRFDQSTIEALKEDEDAKTDRVIKKVRNALMTPNEGREELGLEKVTGNPAMDQLFVEFGMTPIEAAAAPPEPQVDPEEEDEDLDGEEQDQQRGKRGAVAKSNRWREFQTDVRSLEVQMASALRSYFVRQREQTVTRFNDMVLSSQVSLSVNGHIAAKQFLHIEQVLGPEESPELVELSHRHLAGAVKRRGQVALARARARRAHAAGATKLPEDFEFNLHDPEVLRFLEKKVLKFTQDITRTTREQIRRTLVEGQRLGEGISELAIRINNVFEEASAVRALRIAQTEIIGAANFGQLAGMKQSGLVAAKQWLSARDAHVRDSHRATDRATDPAHGGTPVALGQPFDVAGVGLQYPGDQSGPADETVNCRCTVLEVMA